MAERRGSDRRANRNERAQMRVPASITDRVQRKQCARAIGKNESKGRENTDRESKTALRLRRERQNAVERVAKRWKENHQDEPVPFMLQDNDWY